MSMRLIDCFVDVLTFTLAVRERIRRGEQPDYDEVRLGVERRLAAQAGSYSAGGYTEVQYAEAKFAVLAFIDETILVSGWTHRREWARELLQKSHFGTANGGAEFFARLERLSPFEPAERDIREVYFYCLSLGFVGKYYREGDRAALESIRRSVFDALTAGNDQDRSLDGIRLLPAAEPAASGRDTVIPRRRGGVLYYGLPMLLLLAAFLFMRSEIVAAAEYLVTVI